ncbi:MAG: tetratricopeptide repeat protein [Fimbriimonadaceae bacterium]|nr:tetratricopeptide repeat protein [Fimbriimonadaceae bacterium]
MNTLDSRFCRRCGTEIPEAAIEAYRGKLVRLVDEGTAALNANRVQDAILSAETAIEADPTMLPALNLLADARSRRGDVAGALEVMERIVELNPDSELDKIKRNKLRSQLQDSIQVPDAPNRPMAMLAAVAAVVLVISLGVLAAKFAQDQAQNQTGVTRPEIVADGGDAPGRLRGFSDGNDVGNGSANPGTGSTEAEGSGVRNPVVNNPNAAVTNMGAGGNSANDNAGAMREPANLPLPRYRPSTRTANRGRGGLPDVNSEDFSARPVTPPPISGEIAAGGLPDPRPSTARRGGDPDPDPVSGGGSSTNGNATGGNAGSGNSTPTTEPEPDPGEIEITIRGGGKGSAGGGSTRTNGAKALTNTGNQQLLSANPNGAAGAYEKALNDGADPVFTNQRIGQSAARAGDKAKAIAAYQRAIQAGEAALASGKGNRARIQRSIDVSRAALRVLQGG